MNAKPLIFELGRLSVPDEDRDILVSGIHAAMAYYASKQGGLPVPPQETFVRFFWEEGGRPALPIRVKRHGFSVSTKAMQSFMETSAALRIDAAHIPQLQRIDEALLDISQTSMLFNLESGAVTLAQSAPFIQAEFIHGISSTLSSAVGERHFSPPRAVAA